MLTNIKQVISASAALVRQRTEHQKTTVFNQGKVVFTPRGVEILAQSLFKSGIGLLIKDYERHCNNENFDFDKWLEEVKQQINFAKLSNV